METLLACVSLLADLPPWICLIAATITVMFFQTRLTFGEIVAVMSLIGVSASRLVIGSWMWTDKIGGAIGSSAWQPFQDMQDCAVYSVLLGILFNLHIGAMERMDRLMDGWAGLAIGVSLHPSTEMERGVVYFLRHIAWMAASFFATLLCLLIMLKFVQRSVTL
jgi:hypothetical protein